MIKRQIFLSTVLFPFKWVYKKLEEGIKYFLEKPNKIFLIFIPNFFFTVLGISIVFYNFQNIKEDTTSLTNYGFAILAGISSLCFSWARGLNKDEDAQILKKVTICGESFFHSAIIFLLLSAIKYSTIHLEIFIPKKWEIQHNIVYRILRNVHFIGFTLSFYKVNGNICSLNKLLYERTHLQT